jgi:hypothetical protein
MAELAKPYPGWHPPVLRSMECFRQAFCCAAGLHPIRVNFIDPDDYNVDFWLEWQKEFRRQGFYFQRATLEQAERSGLFWIATVPSITTHGRSHAVTMYGDKLYYDSNVVINPLRARKLRPRKFVANPVIPVLRHA